MFTYILKVSKTKQKKEQLKQLLQHLFFCHQWPTVHMYIHPKLLWTAEFISKLIS